MSNESFTHFFKVLRRDLAIVGSSQLIKISVSKCKNLSSVTQPAVIFMLSLFAWVSNLIMCSSTCKKAPRGSAWLGGTIMAGMMTGACSPTSGGMGISSAIGGGRGGLAAAMVAAIAASCAGSACACATAPRACRPRPLPQPLPLMRGTTAGARPAAGARPLGCNPALRCILT
jgi:hypothetical protein